MLHVRCAEDVPSGRYCVSFGPFDGVHLGHRAVLARMKEERDLTPLVISFEETSEPVVYTEREKAELLEETGVGVLLSLPTGNVRGMEPEELSRGILERIGTRALVLGEGRADESAFRAEGVRAGYEVVTVPVVRSGDEPVTTDLLKRRMEAGDFAGLLELLGRPYLMIGEVVHGKAAGRKHGMPTANLGTAPNKLFPPHGVYGTLSRLDGKTYRGMTNVGLRPSDDDIPIPTVETFLLDFDRDIYGKTEILEALVYVRGVRKFAGGLDEVRRQIDRDIESIRDFMDRAVPAKE